MRRFVSTTPPVEAQPAVKRLYSVSVRQLVEFVLRTGDLSSGNRMPTRVRAWEGARGHRKLQSNRPKDYEPEVVIAHEIEQRDFTLKISGRIDGVWKQENGILLEEIKTVTPRWKHQADPLHWAQLKLYGFFYSEQHELALIDLQLSYFELQSEQLTVFREKFSALDLKGFAMSVIGEYLTWIEDQERWRKIRDASIVELKFPYGTFRKGQRNFSAAVYRAAVNGGRVFAEAPTGIGKTMATLFPAVKAVRQNECDHIFYLTAKTTTQELAERAISDMRQAGLRFRSLTLVAKEKLCIQDGKRCDVLTCPFAKGYYDRIKPALQAALQREALTRKDVEELAHHHQLCPHEFSLDCSEWVDAIICDYNYVFDPSAYLKRHFAEGLATNVFLIDEAHNLVERAREMFSAELTLEALREARLAFKKTVPRCASALKKFEEAFAEFRGENQDAIVLADLPKDLLGSLGNFVETFERWLAKDEGTTIDDLALDAYFSVNSFLKIAEMYDTKYRTIVQVDSIRLFCVDPSSMLNEVYQRAKATVLFSATMTPLPYFRAALGGDKDDDLLKLASPFDRDNLKVLLHDGIKTSFRHRDSSFHEVAQTILSFVCQRTGNYLVYFPSYAYLNEVLDRIRDSAPDVEILVQSSKMNDAERRQFLEAFKHEPTRTTLGFAVMGGIFGEGIDLVGERLIGAIIVGVGLPQLCLERNLIRSHYDEQGMSGFDYAYVYPGMNRVLQAVGRVIRSEKDRGAVLLIDARFSESRFQELFPAWWNVELCNSGELMARRLSEFWGGR